MDTDLEHGPSRYGGRGEGGISVNAGFLLGVLAVVRLAAFGLNWWLYCNEGKAGQCDKNSPDVSTVGGHDGARAKYRFASAVLTTVANDLCNWLVLSAAFARPTLAKHAPCPAGYFKFLLILACTLDTLQAVFVDGEYHWAMIQVAGAFMLWVLALLFVTLWKEPEPRNRCCLVLATLLYVGLCMLLVTVLVLYHAGFEGGRSLWARLEYTALIVYTVVLVFLGLTLPDARVRLRMMANVEVLPVESSERSRAGLLSAAKATGAAAAGPHPAAATGSSRSSRTPDTPNPKRTSRRGGTKTKRSTGVAAAGPPGQLATGSVGDGGTADGNAQLLEEKVQPGDTGNPQD